MPTPDEAAAQLLFNLGRGAKGILWFTFRIPVGEQYPDLRQAIQQWNRVLLMCRDDLLSAEPIQAVTHTDDRLDVAVLASWDKLFVLIVNQAYEINDTAYRWRPVKNARVHIKLPLWIQPQSVIALDGEAPKKVKFSLKDRQLALEPGDIATCKFIIVDNNPDSFEQFASAFQQILTTE